MRKLNKKQQQSIADALRQELRAKTKRRALAREILREGLLNDPAALERLFRGNRRRAKWNLPKKRE